MRGEHKDSHTSTTYNTAKRQLDYWLHLHNKPVPDRVWISPLHTGSGCRFGYWKETKGNDESARETL